MTTLAHHPVHRGHATFLCLACDWQPTLDGPPEHDQFTRHLIDTGIEALNRRANEGATE